MEGNVGPPSLPKFSQGKVRKAPKLLQNGVPEKEEAKGGVVMFSSFGQRTRAPGTRITARRQSAKKNVKTKKTGNNRRLPGVTEAVELDPSFSSERQRKAQEVQAARLEQSATIGFHEWKGFRPFSRHFNPKTVRPPLDSPYGVFRAPIARHFRRPPKESCRPDLFQSYEKYLNNPSLCKI